MLCGGPVRWGVWDNSVICGMIRFQKRRPPLTEVVFDYLRRDETLFHRKINIQPRKRSCLMIRQ